MSLLKKTDWSQAFISNRAITFLDRTYSFNSELSYRVQIPNDKDLHWNRKQTMIIGQFEGTTGDGG